MNIITALLIKQCKDSFRNLPSLMILMIYPAVALIMITSMKSEADLDSFFVPMFAAMHCSFAPLVTSSNILSEEKEKGTLRSLVMAGVSRAKYLISLSLFVLASVMVTGSTFLFMKQTDISSAAAFMAAMLTGSAVSTLIGLCIGIYSKNVTAANGMAVPVGLIFALIPMLGQFNEGIGKAAKYTYSGEIKAVFDSGCYPLNAVTISASYFIVLSILLLFLFRRKGME